MSSDGLAVNIRWPGMLTTLAISNYRSLLDLVLPLGRLNVITGPNASGKSNLYRALRLLAETARGGVVQALAREGGLDSTLWAGPESISPGMRNGAVPVQGTPRRGPVRLNLGFAGEEFSYAISLGLPKPNDFSAFSHDPEIKRECIWAGPRYRPASTLIDRLGCVIKSRAVKRWEIITDRAPNFESVFTQIADPARTPELFQLRETIRGWRFYDHFRTDHQAPARIPQLGTRTPVLAHDGSDVAAALQTIREIGDSDALNEAIDDAFPGSSLSIGWTEDGRFSIEFQQPGLLRTLSAAELSDGTLRYILWVAALLTPRPPSLMVLNEPETSLHPDLLPALARLISRAAETTQVWVVSHSTRLIGALNESEECHSIELEKDLGETRVVGQSLLDQPPWEWPK
jgi:predicted ATPase